MSCCSGCFAWASKPSDDGKPSEVQRDQRWQNNEIDLFEQTLEFISKVPLFQTIPMSNHRTLAKAFKLQEFADGSNIINQGELGDTFYVVRSGKAKVVVDGKHVNNLSVGDFFGEQALLNNTARNATITATGGGLQCEVMTREDFQKLDLQRKLNFKKRNAVMMVETSDEHRKATPKTKEEKLFIKEAFSNDKFIGTFLKDLSEQQLQDVCDSAFLKEVPAHTEVIEQGDTKADLFYIVKEGSAEAIKDGEKVASYVAKGSFGGLALLYQAPRAATVKVTSQSKLWCIPRSAMRTVLQQTVKDQVFIYAKLLDKADVFDELSAESKLFIANGLSETIFTKGQFVTEQGKEPTALFILQSGKLSEIENGQQTGIATTAHGKHLPCFGQDELLNGTKYYVTRQVITDTCSLLVLSRDLFQMVFKPRSDLFDRSYDMIAYKRSELSTIGLLGCGGFGKVTLERYGQDGRHFAMKAISKGFVVARSQQKLVMNEKKVMQMIYSPFLIQLAATFNSEQTLFFLLEACLGGELYSVYVKHNLHGKERHAMFYTACVTKGLQHLHERCIIYRDMKPENLLLDDKGYCKIGDFGLAKFCVGKTFTSCGTPEYFAPELVKGIGHTTTLDWWTLGILIFELMMAVSPFAADDQTQMYGKIMRGIGDVTFPKNSVAWPDLVKTLCDAEPGRRLPVRSGGMANLENHAWFKDNRFNWGQLTSRKLPVPFTPKVDQVNTSNFMSTEDEAPPAFFYKDTGDGWDADFEDVLGPKSFEIADESTGCNLDEVGSGGKKGCFCWS